MTIREVLINIRERLQNAGIEDFEYESWAFLDWKLHIDRAEFYMNPNGEVKEELLAELESVLIMLLIQKNIRNFENILKIQEILIIFREFML